MTLQQRAVVVQSGTAGVMIVLAISAVIGLEVVMRGSGRMAASLNDEVARVNDLQLDAERLISTARSYLLTRTSERKRALQALDARFDLAIGRIANVSAYEAVVVARDARAYIETVRTLALAEEAGGYTIGVDRELERARRALETDLDLLGRRVRHDFELARQHEHSTVRSVQLSTVGMAAAAIVSCVILGVWFVRTLERQQAALDASLASARRAGESREELVQIVSHDLRNPLHAIIMAASVMRERAPSDHHVAIVEGAAQRMSRLVDDLLDRARIERGTIALDCTACKVTDLLDAARSMFDAPAREQDVTLSVAPAPTTLLYADRERVLQVFSNLIGNALRHAGGGGSVTVAAAEREGEIVFSVADTGSGIPATELGHVFERYYQSRSDRTTGTLGLGLYIARQLVEAHHGRIGVDSRPGAGTTFWFTLPTAPKFLS